MYATWLSPGPWLQGITSPRRYLMLRGSVYGVDERDARLRRSPFTRSHRRREPMTTARISRAAMVALTLVFAFACSDSTGVDTGTINVSMQQSDAALMQVVDGWFASVTGSQVSLDPDTVASLTGKLAVLSRFRYNMVKECALIHVFLGEG